jgi:hypothetical protein
LDLDSKWELVVQKEIQDKAEAETKKQALLDRLGITQDEAKLLLA